MVELLAIIGLAVLLPLWVLFQRWIAKVHPDGARVDGGCGACGCSAGQCKKKAPEGPH